MADIVPAERRSQMMRGIRSADTTPEIAVRRVLHHLGFRFRLHRKDLPGSPDIALAGRRIAIFVHGCFWHRHDGCRLAYSPKSRVEFWREKFEKNMMRDGRVESELKALGWRPVIVWECETRQSDLNHIIRDRLACE